LETACLPCIPKNNTHEFAEKQTMDTAIILLRCIAVFRWQGNAAPFVVTGLELQKSRFLSTVLLPSLTLLPVFGKLLLFSS